MKALTKRIFTIINHLQYYFFILFISVLIIGCQKQEKKAILPNLSTTKITNITSNSVVLECDILNDGGASILKKGFFIGTNSKPEVNGEKYECVNSSTKFNIRLDMLYCKTEYYVKSYAVNSVGIVYGDQVSFRTLADYAKISTKDVTEITSTSARSGGIILDNGGEEITSKGVCWDVNQNPTIDKFKAISGVGNSEFMSEVTGLKKNTIYYIRAYAINSVGISYGSQKEFKSKPEKPLVSTYDQVITANNTTSTSIMMKGEILDNGGVDILEKGFYYSSNQDAILNGTKIISQDENSTFITELKGLSPDKEYYIVSFATNEIGMSFGDVKIYRTAPKDYIEVGNAKWSKFNLIARKTFASSIYEPGRYFNWGSNIAWSYENTSNDRPMFSVPSGYSWVSNWSFYPHINYWPENSSPCPYGWRLPKSSEVSTLLNNISSTTWYELSSSSLYPFGRYVLKISLYNGETLWFPCASYRNSDGTVNDIDRSAKFAVYWIYDYRDYNAFGFYFSNNTKYNFYGFTENHGLLIRCVKDW